VFFKYQIDVGVGDETAEITFGPQTGQSRSVKEDESLADFLLGQSLDLFSVWDQFLDDVRICDRQKRGVMDVTGGRCCWPLSRQKDDDDINLEVRSCP
jgi:hypothetical protein